MAREQTFHTSRDDADSIVQKAGGYPASICDESCCFLADDPIAAEDAIKCLCGDHEENEDVVLTIRHEAG